MLAGETEFNEKALQTACTRLEGLEWQMQMAGTYAARLQETLTAALAIRAAGVQSASSVVDRALALPLPGAPPSPSCCRQIGCWRCGPSSGPRLALFDRGCALGPPHSGPGSSALSAWPHTFLFLSVRILADTDSAKIALALFSIPAPVDDPSRPG